MQFITFMFNNVNIWFNILTGRQSFQGTLIFGPKDETSSLG